MKSFAARLSSACSGKKKWDAILIDDDALVRGLWELSAQRAQKKVLLCSTPQEFFAVVNEIDRASPIYVDVHLAKGLCGIRVSEEISTQGFSQVHLATGMDQDRYQSLQWVSSVIGKSPPWS
jgi:hypothetical protein